MAKVKLQPEPEYEYVVEKTHYYVQVELSDREIEIIRMISNGLLYKQIADLMAISHKYTQNLIGGLYNKLGVSGKVELVMFAIRMGIIKP
jgi:DNA-binding CsgD family transcriptional regulator